MPVEIPTCSDEAFLAPITVHIKDDAPQRVEFLPLGAPFFRYRDNEIPSLSAGQLHDISKTLREQVKGVLEICQRSNGLYAAFATARERNERINGLDYVIEIASKVEAVAKGERSERPAGEESRGIYSRAFLDRTLAYVRGEVNLKAYLAQAVEATLRDVTETSMFLLQEIKFGSLSSKKGKQFPNSIEGQFVKGALHGYLDGLFEKIDSNPTVARNWKELAVIYSHAGRVIEAVAAARWAVVLDPKDHWNWQALGNAEGLRGRQDSFHGEQRAVAKAEKIDAQAPDNIPKTPKTDTDDTEGNSAPPVATGSPQSSPALQGGSQTMADVGGFDPSEQDLFSTTSTESAVLLYGVTNSTDPNVGIRIVQGSGATTLGLPTSFTVPFAARPAGIGAR